MIRDLDCNVTCLFSTVASDDSNPVVPPDDIDPLTPVNRGKCNRMCCNVVRAQVIHLKSSDITLIVMQLSHCVNCGIG